MRSNLEILKALQCKKPLHKTHSYPNTIDKTCMPSLFEMFLDCKIRLHNATSSQILEKYIGDCTK